jgi:uroporphyrinogen decarboxylase
MNSLERVNCAINHQQPDRTPIDLRFAPEMLSKLLAELKMDESQFWEWAGQDVYTIRPKYKNPATPIKYADPTIEIDKDGRYLDIYRVPFQNISTSSQVYLEPLDLPPLKGIDTIEGINSFPWPKVDAWDYSQISKEIDGKKDKAVWPRSRGCFQTAQLMRGMERFLVDLALEPDFACCIMDRVLDFVIEDARCSIEAGEGKYTYVEYNDDVATQRGMLISPRMWKKYVKPRMKKFCDMVHSHGLKVKYHSCGSIYDIIPDLIEIGVNILNPIQVLAANMDPFNLKKEFGKDLCFHGAIDIQNLLPNGSKQEVKDYVQRVIDVVGKDGGYIMAGTHTIQSDSKVENVITMIETARTL